MRPYLTMLVKGNMSLLISGLHGVLIVLLKFQL